MAQGFSGNKDNAPTDPSSAQKKSIDLFQEKILKLKEEIKAQESLKQKTAAEMKAFIRDQQAEISALNEKHKKISDSIVKSQDELAALIDTIAKERVALESAWQDFRVKAKESETSIVRRNAELDQKEAALSAKENAINKAGSEVKKSIDHVNKSITVAEEKMNEAKSAQKKASEEMSKALSLRAAVSADAQILDASRRNLGIVEKKMEDDIVALNARVKNVEDREKKVAELEAKVNTARASVDAEKAEVKNARVALAEESVSIDEKRRLIALESRELSQKMETIKKLREEMKK